MKEHKSHTFPSKFIRIINSRILSIVTDPKKCRTYPSSNVLASLHVATTNLAMIFVSFGFKNTLILSNSLCLAEMKQE